MLLFYNGWPDLFIVNPDTGYGNSTTVPEHHICTNKNCISTANGGPWTPKYEEFFKGADLDINKSVENLVRVPGHVGPHPKAYHVYVYRQLVESTEGLAKGSASYNQAVVGALERIKKDAVTPGHPVNKWLTKKD